MEMTNRDADWAVRVVALLLRQCAEVVADELEARAQALRSWEP